MQQTANAVREIWARSPLHVVYKIRAKIWHADSSESIRDILRVIWIENNSVCAISRCTVYTYGITKEKQNCEGLDRESAYRRCICAARSAKNKIKHEIWIPTLYGWRVGTARQAHQHQGCGALCHFFLFWFLVTVFVFHFLVAGFVLILTAARPTFARPKTDQQPNL